MPETYPQPRKVRFNLVDVPQPVKERELLYDVEFANSNVGL